MNEVKFISTKYFKENTAVNESVDDDKIVPFIYRAQDINLQTALGTNFLEDLKSKVISATLNTDEKYLLSTYIMPMVNEWTLFYVLPILTFNYDNKSVSKYDSKYGKSAELNELKYMESKVRDMAEFYTKRLNKYLCDNSNLFPAYLDGTKENLPKSKRSYSCGIYFPNSNNGCC